MAVTTSPDWTVSEGIFDRTITYTSKKLYGKYSVDLGEATIKNGDSFTLYVSMKVCSWSKEMGTPIASTDNFNVYFGSFSYKTVKLTANNTVYEMSGLSYKYSTSQVDSRNPVTLSFIFQYINEKDSLVGKDYFIFSAGKDSDVKFDTFTEYNIKTDFNFTSLTSEYFSMPPAQNQETIISITKSSQIPEPSTTAFSLLAIVGFIFYRYR